MDSGDSKRLDSVEEASFEELLKEGEDSLKEGEDSWSWKQNKAFETALVNYWDGSDGGWEKIAAAVPGKSVEDVKQHNKLLEEDIEAIEADKVPLLAYAEEEVAEGGSHGKKGGEGKAPKAEQERRKGIAWSEEEHRLFLLGLEKYGKGDWRSISRNYVITRTPTQVASHAQKYFIRLQSGTKDKRRSSIHDITSVNEKVNQGPITGQQNVPAPASAMTGQQPYQPPAGNPRIPSGPAIGRPVVGPHAVGTPVNIPVAPYLPPSSVPQHMAYRMPNPIPNMVVRGNQTENPYPEHRMENAYSENQMENASQENQTKNTKNTHSKSNKRR